MATLASLPRQARPVDEDKLYRGQVAALERFCLSIVRDPHEAADAAQDAWLRAVTALRAGARPENFQAWLFAIARNRCTDTFRLPQTEALDIGAETVPDARLQPDEQHRIRAELELLWKDVATLSAAQRSAFVMSAVIGSSGDELAVAMGRSTDSCHALAADARTSIRDRRRGRESACEEIRAHLQASRDRSRVVAAHLEVCADCSAEARRERSRRLLRSLALVPLPLPLFGRLRAAQAWLQSLFGPAGAASDRVAAVTAAGVATAAVALGGATGGIDRGAQPLLPTGPAKSAPAVVQHAVVVRRAASVRAAERPSPPRWRAATTAPRRGVVAAVIAPVPTTAQSAREPITRHVERVPRPVERTATTVLTASPPVAAVVGAVEQVETTASGAVPGLSALPNS
jgi:RNA polymerase sigma factor (sigma-70 family)